MTETTEPLDENKRTIRRAYYGMRLEDLLDEIVTLTLTLDASRVATASAMSTIRRQTEEIQRLEIRLGNNI
jgi:hypothetical protein